MIGLRSFPAYLPFLLIFHLPVCVQCDKKNYKILSFLFVDLSSHTLNGLANTETSQKYRQNFCNLASLLNRPKINTNITSHRNETNRKAQIVGEKIWLAQVLNSIIFLVFEKFIIENHSRKFLLRHIHQFRFPILWEQHEYHMYLTRSLIPHKLHIS